MFRYEGAAWERRFLPRLTYAEVEAMDKEDALVILPVGAVEQHGPHLPLMTDALIGESLITRTLEQLPESASVWLLPPVSYGKSNEHLDFAGTISLSAATLQSVITDIAVSLQRSGFRRLMLFNTHGGNVDLLNVASREIRVQTGMMVFYVNPHSLDADVDLVTPEEHEYGIHGGDIETSLVMAFKPDWVKADQLVCEMPQVTDLQYLTLEGRIRFAWVMSDISRSGIAGDATQATADKGETIATRIASGLALALEEICRFDIDRIVRDR
ncbi:creatininase family protein [Paenibacillus sp. 1P07SE]|uniref:creatininase family protein n=1 Tax=Paenibacillus sp. 1P07SE TaxID=3132209 RepID=UPI0039A5131D